MIYREVRGMRKRQVLLLLMILLAIMALPTTVLAEWKIYYKQSLSLPQNNIWRISIGFGVGTDIEISVQMNLAIDIYVTDEDNMNKFWNLQPFTAIVSHEGVAGKTFQFTISVDHCYLCIDNTNVFGTPSTGTSSGTLRISFYDRTTDDLTTIIVTIIFVTLCVITAGIAIYAYWWRKNKYVKPE